MKPTTDAMHLAGTASASRLGAALGFAKPWGTCGSTIADNQLGNATTKRPTRHLGPLTT